MCVVRTYERAIIYLQPDLIILSAGFDGSAKDIGNQKHAPNRVIQGMDLQKKDYLWLTQEIRRVAGIVCAGRVISVLEGGYGSHHVHRKRNFSAATTVDNANGNDATTANKNGGTVTESTQSSAETEAKRKAEKLKDIYAGGLDRRELADNCVQHVRGLIASTSK